MITNFLEIENVTPDLQNRVEQSLKFKTGKFLWKIKFTAPLNPKTVNNVNMYVTSLNNVPLKTSIRYDTVNNTVEIEPLEAYAQNESYILVITKNVKSKGGQSLGKDYKLQFKL